MGYPTTHTSAATAAVANRFVLSTNMIVGSYGAPANSGTMPTAGARLVTVTHTVVAGSDTLGTIAVVGVDILGQTRTDTIVPLSGTIATGVIPFTTVTSVTGAGWVAVSTADTIVVGCAAAAYVSVRSTGTLWGVSINTTAAGTVTIADATGTLIVLPSSAAVGFYNYNLNFSGYLTVTAAAASDLTIMADGSLPAASSYAF